MEKILIVVACVAGAVGWWLFALTRMKLKLAQDNEQQLRDAFSSLSSDALEKNNRSFLHLAESVLGKFHDKAKGELEQKEKAIDHLVKPVQETLTKLDQEMRNLEKERKGDHGKIHAQLQGLIDAEKALRTETTSLAKALRTPSVRGRWGELQLRRVVELAGMVKNCDFFEQTHTSNGESAVRPDLIVRLPGDKQVIVDAKAPLSAYLDAQEMDDGAERKAKMQEHARQVKAHLTQLGKKAYWERFAESPEFVVLFLPSEAFFSSALELDPTLIEMGASLGVIMATPTTLIGLLRAVAHGWKQEAISQNAREISQLGHELYKRLTDMSGHFSKVGKTLNQSVDAYNKTLASLETRVLVSARKFQELNAARKDLELPAPEFVEKLAKE